MPVVLIAIACSGALGNSVWGKLSEGKREKVLIQVKDYLAIANLNYPITPALYSGVMIWQESPNVSMVVFSPSMNSGMKPRNTSPDESKFPGS